ncbi:MAG: hypothetical protein M1820_010279 [Bogoriella megaspora]|nr:MAG: hypothetical protein M1820_010279 [Bogoriella megaspora]
MQFKLINASSDHPPPPSDPSSASFTLTAKAGVDIWRTPESAGGRDDFAGVILATELKLKSFNRATVKVSADWKSQYAQGGLILFSSSGNSSSSSPNPPLWIKTGIEFEDKKLFASVVAANPYSDWSLQPWKESTLTVEAIRERNGLWIYAIDGEERLPLRQLTWAFEGQDQGKDIQVGVFAAMPKGLEGVEGGGELTVKFEDFVVETL